QLNDQGTLAAMDDVGPEAESFRMGHFVRTVLVQTVFDLLAFEALSSRSEGIHGFCCGECAKIGKATLIFCDVPMVSALECIRDRFYYVIAHVEASCYAHARIDRAEAGCKDEMHTRARALSKTANRRTRHFMVTASVDRAIVIYCLVTCCGSEGGKSAPLRNRS